MQITGEQQDSMDETLHRLGFSIPGLRRTDRSSGAGTKSVLLVDDVPGVLEVLTYFLARTGLRVLPCLSAREALEQWDHEQGADLLITDLKLGQGLTGLQLAQRLTSFQSSLAVIYISGSRVELQDPTLFVEGINYLPKPFNPTVLASLANRILANGQSHPAPFGPGFCWRP